MSSSAFERDDNEPTRTVLATDRDGNMVEYATGSISNQLFVPRYQLYWLDMEVLKAELRRLLAEGYLGFAGFVTQVRKKKYRRKETGGWVLGPVQIGMQCVPIWTVRFRKSVS